MQLQELWSQSATVFFVAAVSVVALALARRKVVAPLVVFGAAFLVARTLGFVLAYFVSAEGAVPVVQVLTHYARIAPSVLLLIYACLVLARRYRTARNKDALRVGFLWSPYVHGGAVLVNLVGDLAIRPPLLEGARGISVSSFFVSIPNYATAIVYAGLAAYVFMGAARPGAGSLSARQRLQNFFWGVALAGLCVLTAFAIVRHGIRAFAPEGRVAGLVESLSSYETVFYVAYAGGIALGIFSYYTQSGQGRFLERFHDFLGLVGDLAEEMVAFSPSRHRLGFTHASMVEAAGEEFLGLEKEDERKMDIAFRARVVWEHRAASGAGGRIDRKRLADLLEAYEHEFEEPVLARGLRAELGEDDDRLPEVLRDLTAGGRGGPRGLGAALAVVLRSEAEEAQAPEGPELEDAPVWEQLVYVALADANLLPDRLGKALLDGWGVSERVLEAYRLAQYKLQTRV